MPRTILAVYAHPDDETSSAGALMAMYHAQGVAVHVITATRGELGSLGTGGMVIEREDLPKVREAEIRAVLAHYGLTDGPLFLDYRDQELKLADFEEVVGKIVAEMERVRPDVVLTFGPHGISGHDDHVALHEQTVAAFERYRAKNGAETRLLYTAIPKAEADHFNLHLDGPSRSPTWWWTSRTTGTSRWRVCGSTARSRTPRTSPRPSRTAPGTQRCSTRSTLPCPRGR